MSDLFATPRPVATLVVLDAAAKIAVLAPLLRRAGLGDCHLFATDGPLRALPSALVPFGIDRHWRETGRAPRDSVRMAALQAWAGKAGRVLVACDVDEAGDVLAADVAAVVAGVAGARPCLRIALRGLDFDSVVDAFAHPAPVTVADGAAGAARRLLERLVAGGVHACAGAAGDGVGHIEAALLGLLAKTALPYQQLTLALPSADGGAPFVAELDVDPHNAADAARLRQAALDFEAGGGRVTPGATVSVPDMFPWTYGRAVLSIARATERPVADVAQSLRRLYEAGCLSYPRSGATAISGEGLTCLSEIADRNGVRFDPALLPTFVRSGWNDHEAPRPLHPGLEICAPLGVMAQDQAVLALLARQLLACGQPQVAQQPDVHTLPDWARALPFERRLSLWLSPWPRRAVSTAVRQRPPAEAVLDLLLTSELGPPGERVEHALAFVRAGLVDDRLALTARARALQAALPAMLLDGAVAPEVERLVVQLARDEGQSGAAQLVRGALDFLGLLDRVRPLLEDEPEPWRQSAGGS